MASGVTQNFDRLLAQASSEQVPAVAERIVDQLQQMVVDACPIIYLYNPNRITCMLDSVKGYVYFSDHLIRYRLISKE